ncbi:MAG: hypothetical protein ACN4GZ_05055, partial [Acidimicrobiales bacterium]
AIETNPLIRLGEEIAKANRLDHKIEFIQALSTEIDLPEKADVIFSDLRGVLPFYTQHLPAVRDARERHLAPGGVMIPTRDRVFASVAANPSRSGGFRSMWTDNPFGLDLSLAIEEQTKQMRDDRVGIDDLLSEPVQIAEIDYRSTLSETGFRYSGTVEITKDGVAHGISAWFEGAVLEHLTYSSAPDQPEMVYGMAFFPFRTPVDLRAGSEIRFEVAARLVGEYVWEWGASAQAADGSEWSVSHTMLDAAPLDLETVRRRKASYVPPASELMKADLLCLNGLVQGHSLGSVAQAVHETHRDIFPTPSAALTWVADTAGRYET